jgi:hypothetical protein
MGGFVRYPAGVAPDRGDDSRMAPRCTWFVLLFAMLLAAGLSGCFKSSSGKVTALSPTTGSVGTAVSITGTGFGVTQASNSTVTFNGTTAMPISWSSTSIVVNVPSGATTGNVIVTVAGVAGRGSNFIVNAITPSGCGGVLGSEGLLNGSYAYVMSGFQGVAPGTYFDRAGSFVADGTGGISSGEEDFNVGTNGDDLHTVTSGSYSVGPDDRGCMTLDYSDGLTATFRFSLGDIGGVTAKAASRGRAVEFDDSTGLGYRASGTILQQTTGDLTGGVLQANYAFGLQGVNSSGGRVTQAGAFTLAPGTTTSNVSRGYFDYNNAGTVVFAGGTDGASAGTLNTTGSSISSTTGRTTGTFVAEDACAATCTYHWVVYIVDRYQFIVASSDILGANTPLVAGQAAASTTGYSTGSLNNSDGYIIEATGATAGEPNAELEQLQFTTANVSGTEWTYAGGAAATSTVAGAPFEASRVGRFTFGNTVLYLTNPSVSELPAAFVVTTDLSVAEGLMVAQQSFKFSPSGNGRFFFGSDEMAHANVRNQIGVAGAVPNSSGSSVLFGGATDQNAATATNVLSSSTFLTTLAISSTNGAASGSDANGAAIVGLADGNAMFYIDETGEAVVTVVEQ